MLGDVFNGPEAKVLESVMPGGEKWAQFSESGETCKGECPYFRNCDGSGLNGICTRHWRKVEVSPLSVQIIAHIANNFEYYDRGDTGFTNDSSEIISLKRRIGEVARGFEVNDYNRFLDQEVAEALKSKKARRTRLKTAPKFPQTTYASQKVYMRNPDVVAEVLDRAGGICESCENPAPFIRARDGLPYLEVHHVVPLSEGGEDTVENAVGVCPNCHRRFHFGVE